MNEHPFSYSESENAPVAPGLERRIRVRMAEAQEAARINRADADSKCGWCGGVTCYRDVVGDER